MSKATDHLISSLPKGWQQWIMSAVMVLLSSMPGVISWCQESGVPSLQSICGHDLGMQERINMALAPKYLMQPAVREDEFEISDGHRVRTKIYGDGVVAVFQLVNDAKAVGGYRQNLIFLTPDPWEEVLESVTAMEWSLVDTAHAQNIPPPIHLPFQDAVMERSPDGYYMRIQRVYSNGCVDHFWVYIPNGAINWSTFRRFCP